MPSLHINQFDYHLPQERIAQQPAKPRDHSRLLLVNRQTNQISHHYFYDLPQILSEISQKTVLVRNNTKVIPARIWGHKQTGGKVEVLLLKRKSINPEGETWECLTKPGLNTGQTITFPNQLLTGFCTQKDGYIRYIKFNKKDDPFFEALYQIGHTPIPPYIEWNQNDEQTLREKYQTIYAKYQGSAAAPTAGLHFTPEVDRKLNKNSVQIEIEEVTLHVGLGTFQPVKENDITHHQMHCEWFELNAKTANNLNQAKRNGKKIIAVGTTTTRVLESTCTNRQLRPTQGETDIYIYPPYKFKFIDGLLTNFHLPKSTLLMLVSAFVSYPNTPNHFTNFTESLIGKAYQEAIDQNYRFYSFGDAMLII